MKGLLPAHHAQPFFFHPCCSIIPVGDRQFHQFTGSIKHGKIHTPGIHAYACYAFTSHCTSLVQTFDDFTQYEFNIPAFMSVPFYDGIGEAVYFPVLKFSVGDGPQHDADIAGPHVYSQALEN